MSAAPDVWLRMRSKHTASLAANPYDASIYLERAMCFEELHYPDLAASDAYKALILNDEVRDGAGEYHEAAVEAILASGNQPYRTNAVEYLRRDSSEARCTDGSRIKDATGQWDAEERGSWPEVVVEHQSRQAYEILARTLLECGDLKSAWDFAERGCKAHPSNGKLKGLQAQILSTYSQGLLRRDHTWDTKSLDPRKDLPQNGHVRREIYPWNIYEPDRFSSSALSFLTAEIVKIAPKLEVRSVELPLLDSKSNITPSPDNNRQQTGSVMLKQLGLFTTSNIPPHEYILFEPSILTANNRLHDPLCDACSAPLPISVSSPLPCCPSCDDTVFCSTSCLDRAQRLYHPAICGHSDYDVAARDPSPTAATNALYVLLLARTIAMAETQNSHPLSLPETKYLWGDFTQASAHATPTHVLPFSFQTNIATPLHLLEKLNLNVFAPETMERYDTWVINTLMAKFRGVASAKMNPRTGMPEVCAVHWRWCLANHSCAPNVRWEWPAQDRGSVEMSEGSSKEREQGGCMALVARGGEDVVQWGPEGSGKGEGGIRKGEEVLSHYCDVDLRVEARREWAAGALGGMCVCERCVWEATRPAREET